MRMGLRTSVGETSLATKARRVQKQRFGRARATSSEQPVLFLRWPTTRDIPSYLRDVGHRWQVAASDGVTCIQSGRFGLDVISPKLG